MKTDALREQITNQVVNLMKEHGSDWVKPWATTGAGSPTNLASKKHYHGINTLILMAEGRTSPAWGTYKQWKAKDCQVHKGEHGTHIIFWKILEKPDRNNPEKKAKIPLMRNYTVFNAEQVDGGEEYIPTPEDGAGQHFQQYALDQMIEATGAHIQHGGDRAFFSPSHDIVQMPLMESFKGTDTSTAEETYYSTLCHELTHWSGHTPRLDRLKSTRFGSKDYAYEELIAELGAAFLGVEYGFSPEPRPDHAKYLNSWIEKLGQDHSFIIKAAQAASKAVDHVTGYQEAQQQEAA